MAEAIQTFPFQSDVGCIGQFRCRPSHPHFEQTGPAGGHLVVLQVTGGSMHHYLKQTRLLTALEPLAAGETEITALALDLGYSPHSHFTQPFRRTFGVPPPRCGAPRSTASARCAPF